MGSAELPAAWDWPQIGGDSRPKLRTDRADRVPARARPAGQVAGLGGSGLVFLPKVTLARRAGNPDPGNISR
jgi:hypothetical protein